MRVYQRVGRRQERSRLVQPRSDGLVLLNRVVVLCRRQIERLCTAYPNACFIAGHSAGNYHEVTRRVENLFVCTCPLLAWGQAEDYVARYGADRLLFGSDLSDLPIAWDMAQILYAKISEQAKRKIMGENLKRLMAQYSLPPTA